MISDDGNDKKGVNWILSHYGRYYEEEFISVCVELGYPVLSQKMAAMWQESNVGVGGQRVIQRYLVNEFGTCLIVPMKEITHLGKPHVPPVCSYHETADKRRFIIGLSLLF